MFDVKIFGPHLQAKRKNANMTQLELAESLGLTRQAISKYETGESFPDISILIKMSEIFNTTMDELVHPNGVAALMHPEVKEAFIQKLLAGEISPEFLQDALPYVESLMPLIEAAVFEGALPQSMIEVLNAYSLGFRFAKNT